MKKIVLLVLIGIFTACSENEEVCNNDCWQVLEQGNLGATLRNTCSGITKDYIYTKDNLRFDKNDVVCNINFN
jgi:hypothetical protein